MFRRLPCTLYGSAYGLYAPPATVPRAFNAPKEDICGPRLRPKNCPAPRLKSVCGNLFGVRGLGTFIGETADGSLT